MAKRIAIAVLTLLLSACGTAPPKQLASLSEEFVYTSLSFSPASATGAGLHTYQKQNLDEMLDDLSPASLARQKRFYENFQQRLNALNAIALSAEDQADFAMLQDQTSLALLDLNTI